MDPEPDKLSHFMRGLSSTTQLLQRAGENGFFVEYICLATAVIDASLRIGLILQHQIKTRTVEILDSLLYQADEDRIVSERQIYTLALKESILSQDLLGEMSAEKHGNPLLAYSLRRKRRKKSI